MEYVEFVKTKEEILDNIKTLNDYLNPYGYLDKRRFALDLIKNGICFVAYKDGDIIKFAPSRFLGYLNNDMAKHEANDYKDGRETNPIISDILRSEPSEDPEMEVAYQAYCSKLYMSVGKNGSFGRKRKFWRMF